MRLCLLNYKQIPLKNVLKSRVKLYIMPKLRVQEVSTTKPYNLFYLNIYELLSKKQRSECKSIRAFFVYFTPGKTEKKTEYLMDRQVNDLRTLTFSGFRIFIELDRNGID